MSRGEVRAAYASSAFSVSAKYAYIEKQPLYGFDVDRAEVSGGASAKIGESWRVFASGTYDIESDTLLNRGAGFSYSDECFTYMMTFSQSFSRYDTETSTSIGFNLSFRTLGDIGTGT